MNIGKTNSVKFFFQCKSCATKASVPYEGKVLFLKSSSVDVQVSMYILYSAVMYFILTVILRQFVQTFRSMAASFTTPSLYSRKVQALGLAKTYKEDSALRQEVKMLFALPLLPQRDMIKKLRRDRDECRSKID